VWRADRASCHRTDEVEELLRGWGVLRLHGPPHLARFYGQLERQNREHRSWLASCAPPPPGELPDVCERMRHALNTDWRRPTLGWKAAADVWTGRAAVHENRNVLREEVVERAARIARTMAKTGSPDADLAHRLAVEYALTQRGYLRQQSGGWC
jgi:hypothetical protein